MYVKYTTIKRCGASEEKVGVKRDGQYTLSWFFSSKPAEWPAFLTMKLAPS